MAKREPTLADFCLNEEVVCEHKGELEKLRSQLLMAKRFVLDEEAALYIAEMIRDIPRIIADAQDFAIPPFHTMWIEYPAIRFWETTSGRIAPEDERNSRVGFLIVGNVVQVIVGDLDKYMNTTTGRVGFVSALLPLYYTLNHPLSHIEELALCMRLQVSRAQLDYYYWGETHKSLGQDEALRSLRDSHGFHLTMSLADPEKRELWGKMIWGAGGDLRNIIAILLFLNRTHDIQTRIEVPTKQGFIGKKLRPYLKHNVISLKLNPKPRLLTLVPGKGIWKRLHDVRGHYKHDRQAKCGCLHGAPSSDLKDLGDRWIEYEPLRWKCELCGGKRWWQPSHKRGHDEKGEIVSEYAVSANPERRSHANTNQTGNETPAKEA
jgi:hypothetical protein